MKSVHGLEVSQKILLGEEGFRSYQRENRKWYAILSLCLVSIFVMVAASINYKELELGIYIGGLLFLYLIPLGILAAKNKVSPLKWILLTLITTPILGFVITHLLMTRKGFKNEWLSL